MKPRTLLIFCVGLALVAIGLGVYVSSRNHGLFVYSLDDPYIHLDLARQIAFGHYGINSSEYSSPSSSILWPVLLAPAALQAWAVYLPLSLCFLCAIATIAALGRFLPVSRWQIPALLLFAVLTNSIGLIFTGMEHSLQVLLATLAAIGLYREVKTGQIDKWWLAVLVLQPMVRYENMIITAVIAAYLWTRGYRRTSAVVLVMSIIPLIAFSLYLKSLGLDALPNSVLAKEAAGTGNPVITIVKNCYRNFRDHTLEVATLLVIAGAVAVAARRTAGPTRSAGYAAVAAVALHIIGGRFGWMGRYEPYIFAFILVSIYFFWLESPSTRWVVAFLVLMIPGLLFYSREVVRVPWESHRIYQQQYQMHRFAVDYWKKPVAINDLGWVAWENPNYVLDLFGLASKEALSDRLHSKDTAWMERLAREKHVGLVMIYDLWFKSVPTSWTKVAVLTRLGDHPLSADDHVSFYATDEGSLLALGSELQDFSTTLPPDVTIDILKPLKNLKPGREVPGSTLKTRATQ